MILNNVELDEFALNAIEQLVTQIHGYLQNVDEDLLRKACIITINAHHLQKRQSGEPYYIHPFEVARILAEMKLDMPSIVTALLHDTVEDSDLTLDYIKQEFGEEVAKLVDGVTKLTKIDYQPDNIRQAENFRKLLLAMSEDIRVLLVKLADRLHNMRTLGFKSAEKRMKIAHETMEIYAPLSERIGIQKIKMELQDISFREMNAEAYNSITTRLNFLRKDGEIVVQNIVEDIKLQLKKYNIAAEVYGREKSIYSIWCKMERKNISFEQLSDIIAFRIIVENNQQCYEVLGAIHSAYNNIPGSLKDFVSTPKNNGYQSLHTIVIGPNMQRIEVQIRTQYMHQIAELGVAAHWVYKQGEAFTTEGRQFRWIRELLMILDRASYAPEDFLENTKLEMYYDQVFCFSPRGEIIALPRGATPIDFAYAVHSDLGNQCVGAKINSKISPLKTHLQNGDQVEIITSKNQTPSPSWEKIVVTGKARSEVRRFIRIRQHEEYINLGKTMVSRIMRSEGIEENEKLIESGIEIFKRKNLEEFYSAVGEGSIQRQDIINFLSPNKKKKSKLSQGLSMLRLGKNKAKAKENAIPIRGLIPGMAMHFAGCCHPLPGDKIVGIVNTGKGITIHTIDCDLLENYSSTPERWIDVAWEHDAAENNYIGRVKIISTHEPGTLATITSAIAKDLGNITNLKITNRSLDFFEIIIDIQVKGVKHLHNIITSLRSKNCIHSVERSRV